MTTWNCRIFVLGLLIIQSIVNGQNFDTNPFLNGYANDVNGFIADQQKQNQIDMNANVFLRHVVSSRAAQFSGPQYLPPVEKQQLICSGQEVCVRKNSCQNGYFTSQDLNRDSRQDCDSATETCCSYKPPVKPSTPCTGSNYGCVSPNQCSNGEVTINGYQKQSSSDKCFAPEVCCRIPPPDSTVLQHDGYVLRKPENPLNVPDRPQRPQQPTPQQPRPQQPRPQQPRPTPAQPRQPYPQQPQQPYPQQPEQPYPQQPQQPTPQQPRPQQPRPQQPQQPRPQQPQQPRPQQPQQPRPQQPRPQQPQQPRPTPQQPRQPTPQQPRLPTPQQPRPQQPRVPTTNAPEYLPPRRDEPQPEQPRPQQPQTPRPQQPRPQQPQTPRPQQPRPQQPGYPTSQQPSYPTPQQPGYPTPQQPGYPTPPQPAQPGYPTPPQPPQPSYPAPTQPSQPQQPRPQQPRPQQPRPQQPRPQQPRPQQPRPQEPRPQEPRPQQPRPQQPPRQPQQPPTYLPPRQDEPRPTPTRPDRPDRPYRPDRPDRGEGILSEPIPRPQRPITPIISNDIGEPQAPSTCAAALNCTQIEYCTATGDISDTQVILTPDQELFRVPLTDCYNPEKGFYGKCCRDLGYTDPWPVNQLGQYQGIDFGDDGSYKPEQVRRRREKLSNNNVKRGVSEANTPVVERVSISNVVPNNKCATRNLDATPLGIQSIDAPFSMYPWQAMVLLESTKSLLCGGIIIAPDVVATAAHCVHGRKNFDILIKGGEWKLGRDEEPLTFQLSRAKLIDIHPEYDSNTLHNDMALIHVDSKLKFDSHIGALCLNDTEPQPTDECYTTGWGKLALKVHLQDAIMHHSAVQYLSRDQCDQADQTKICGKPNIDACELDPGSALACTNGNGQYVLKGIYSSANECGNSVILFAKPDLTWIHQSLQNNGKSLI